MLTWPPESESGAIAKWTSICFSTLRKLKIKIDTCKIRLSSEARTTRNCNLSSGCCEYPEKSRKQAPFPHPVSAFSALSLVVVSGLQRDTTDDP